MLFPNCGVQKMTLKTQFIYDTLPNILVYTMEVTWKYNNYRRNQLITIFVEILYHENGMISNATFLDKKKPDNLYIIHGFKLRQP